MNDVWILLGFVVVMVAIVGLAFYFQPRAGRIVKGIAAATGGTHQRNQGSGKVGDVTFSFQYREAGGGTPAKLLVSVPVAAAAGFQVFREKALERAFKLAGVSQEAQTGDEAFDAEFYLASDSPQAVTRAFSSSGNRSAVRRIFAHDCESLNCNGTEVTATLDAASRDADSYPVRVIGVVPELAALAASLRQTAQPALPGQVAVQRRALNATALVALILGLLVLFGLAQQGYRKYVPVDEWGFALAALGLSALAAVLIAVALFKAQDPTLPPRALLAFPLVVLTCVPPVGWFGGGWLNAVLDTGPATVHIVPALGRHITSGKHTAYVVTVESWRRGGTPVEIRDAGLYDQVRPGASLVAVTTRPGLFGFEWVADASHRGPPVPPSPSRK